LTDDIRRHFPSDAPTIAGGAAKRSELSGADEYLHDHPIKLARPQNSTTGRTTQLAPPPMRDTHSEGFSDFINSAADPMSRL
jgi:hypothetical protein